MTSVNTINYPVTVTDFQMFPPAVKQPALSAYLTSNVGNVTGDGAAYQVIFNTVAADQTSSLDTSTGTYTVPLTGVYAINGSLAMGGCTTSVTKVTLEVNINGSTSVFPLYFNPSIIRTSSNLFNVAWSCMQLLTAGDVVKIYIAGYGTTRTMSVTGASLQNTNWGMWMVS